MRPAAWVLLTAYPLSGFAHEGHGTLSNSVLHQLGEPQHVLPLLLIVVGLLAVVLKRKLDKNR